MNTIDGPGEMFSGNAESMNTVMVFALGMTMGLRSGPVAQGYTQSHSSTSSARRGAWADRQALNLLNGLIDPEQEGRRHFQTKLFSGLQIEMKREPGWLLHRKVAGLGSLEDFNDKSGDLSESS